MKRLSYTIISFLLFAINAFAQKVANYAVGKYKTTSYEHFSFWQKDNKRAEIYYSHGTDAKEIPVKYAGKATYKGMQGFKVILPQNYTLLIIPNGSKLQVIGEHKPYNKVFGWEYEGPVNGVGTFCNVCAQSEQDAIKVLRNYFMR